MWKKTSSISRHCKPRPELQQQFQERSKSGNMWLHMISGQLGNWRERSGIYAGRIHCMVYGLDRVMSFSGRWLVLDGVAQRTNSVDDILLHDAWCMGDGNNYSGPPCIDAFFFCMISSISKGRVKYRTRM